MSDKSFQFEMLKLTWDRFARSLLTDRFLTDYSAIWRGLPHDEKGVSGSTPPMWDTRVSCALK